MTPDGVLALLADVLDETGDPVATAPEVAVDAPVTRRTILSRLEVLEARGAVASKTVGSGSRVWWIDEETNEPPAEPSAVPPAEPPGEPPGEPPEESEPSVETVDLPGQGDVVTERRQALRDAVAFIQGSEEGARAGEIREAVYETSPARYDSSRSLWKNCLQTALGKVEEVELVDQHSGTWAAADT